MRARDARLPVTVLGVLLAALTVWSFRHFAQYQPFADLAQRAAPDPMGRIGLQIYKATVTGREGGRRRWRVSCGLITFSRDRRQVTVDDVNRGLLYDDAQRPVASVRAGHATYQVALGDLMESGNPAGGALRMFGGIRATLLRSPGLTLHSDTLTWDALRNVMECPGAVSARTGGLTAVGHAVTLDTHQGNVSLHSLSGTLRVPGEILQDMANTSSARTTLLVGGSLSLLAAGRLAAAPAPQSPDVNYEAGYLQYLDTPRVMELSQGVTFNQDDSYLKTASALVNLSEQHEALNAKSSSPVHLYNPQDDLTGSQGYIDFTRHLATLETNVVLVVKPGPQEAQAPTSSLRSRFKDAATITCQRMTYDYRRKLAVIPGALTVHQKDRVLTADSGEYDSRTQIVTLTGNVHGHNGVDEIVAPKAFFGVEEGKEFVRIPGHVTGHWRVKDDQSGPPGPTPTDTPATTPPAPAFVGQGASTPAPAPKL